GDVGPHGGGQLLEVTVEVLERLAHQVGPDAQLPDDEVAVDALAVGGWFEVEAGEQLVPDRFGEAPAALGGAAPMLLTGVEVEHDDDFGGAGKVIRPEVKALPAGKVVEELVVAEGRTVAALAVTGYQLVGIQFGTDADVGNLDAVVQPGDALTEKLDEGVGV